MFACFLEYLDPGKNGLVFDHRNNTTASLAAALTGKAGQGPIVCVVSGGNIDLKKFCELVG